MSAAPDSSRDPEVTRRELLARGGAALAVLAFFDSPLFAQAHPGETTIAFLDQPAEPPIDIPNLLDWDHLDSWLTPADRFFAVGHFGVPEVDADAWRLEVGGLVERPRRYTLADLRALPREEVVFTLECSGNSGFDWFSGGIGNARWAGVPLGRVLDDAGVRDGAIEVVFVGADRGQETLPYIGGLGDHIEDFEVEMSFARSMSLQEAREPHNILCYEMNGEPLPAGNGSPLRLIAPRWYGIANVKWLRRIELRSDRFVGPFMSQRYVTVREEQTESGESVWRRTLVGRARLKSIPARVAGREGSHRIYGAAWGAPVERVEVRIDDGPWRAATIDEGAEHDFAWKFWHLDWEGASTGEHTVTSRAVGRDGAVQPPPEDPSVAGRHTYWEANEQITRRVRIG